MSFSNAMELAVLNITFNATAWANMADNAASSPQTNIGISLHTADPGDAGDASTSEIAYTNYTRINVARNTTGWPSAASGSISPGATITFPTGGAGSSGTATHFGCGRSNATPPTGAQVLHCSGTVTPNISYGNGLGPYLSTSTAITLD